MIRYLKETLNKDNYKYSKKNTNVNKSNNNYKDANNNYKEDYYNISYTGNLRSNRDNPNYELTQGTKVKILEVIKDFDIRRTAVGCIGTIDSPMNTSIGAILSVRNLEPSYQHSVNNINLYEGDKIQNLYTNEIITL